MKITIFILAISLTVKVYAQNVSFEDHWFIQNLIDSTIIKTEHDRVEPIAFRFLKNYYESKFSGFHEFDGNKILFQTVIKKENNQFIGTNLIIISSKGTVFYQFISPVSTNEAHSKKNFYNKDVLNKGIFNPVSISAQDFFKSVDDKVPEAKNALIIALMERQNMHTFWLNRDLASVAKVPGFSLGLFNLPSEPHRDFVGRWINEGEGYDLRISSDGFIEFRHINDNNEVEMVEGSILNTDFINTTIDFYLNKSVFPFGQKLSFLFTPPSTPKSQFLMHYIYSEEAIANLKSIGLEMMPDEKHGFYIYKND